MSKLLFDTHKKEILKIILCQAFIKVLGCDLIPGPLKKTAPL